MEKKTSFQKEEKKKVVVALMGNKTTRLCCSRKEEERGSDTPGMENKEDHQRIHRDETTDFWIEGCVRGIFWKKGFIPESFVSNNLCPAFLNSFLISF